MRKAHRSWRRAVAPPEHNGGAIEAMVERLAERLKKDGSDVAGWIQLVRSYRVLGKADKVKAAIADAHTALANNQEALQRLDQGLAALEAEAIPNSPSPDQLHRQRARQMLHRGGRARATSRPPRRWRRPSGPA